MKFSEIKKEEWIELKPYLDTCLIPYAGLKGDEEPWAVTERLEQLRDVMDLVERPFAGRVVTYPAVQYCFRDDEFALQLLASIAENLKSGVFKFVVVAAPAPIDGAESAPQIDLVIHPGMESADVQDKILELWGK